ncbi:ADP-ribosylglycohydrolase family protein [Myxococcota bacterium]|nr:ADP-ribosylglycohydrolase family protein [Myxococcota bacterium]MBU1379333.1 ADP-ribosylglycohydrolase family protein [Myxococcota bacterium]MBU1496031.1 ADP-ribosylglycohydrolase family protein [Myxococcota bacterium]
MIAADKYIGCFAGLAVGDAFGAPYEGGFIEKLVWKIIGRTENGRMRYTDDTQMSLDIATSFLKHGEINQDHLADTFAASYKWSRGYGPAAGKILKKIRAGSHWSEVNRQKYRDGSLGNGAAMRSPILALCYLENNDLLTDAVFKASEITHAHPLAIEGAQLIAFVTVSVLKDISRSEIITGLLNKNLSKIYYGKLKRCFELLETAPVKTRELGIGITATESCITAIYFGLGYQNESFEKMLRDIADIGGDTDTIGAMAGAIWGSANGFKAFESLSRSIEDIEKIIKTALALHEHAYSAL